MKALVKFEPSQEIIALEENATIHLATAQVHTVNSVDTYNAVDGYIGDVVSDLKTVESYKELAVRGLKDMLDERTIFFNPIIKKLQAAKKDLQGKQKKWNKRQEQVAAAAQLEADEAAAKLAREAYVKVHKENEGKSPEVIANALQEAVENEIAAPVIMAATPQGRTKYRDKWVMEIVDLKNLILYIAYEINVGRATDEVMNLLQANQSHMNKIADTIRIEGPYTNDKHVESGLRIVNDRIPVS